MTDTQTHWHTIHTAWPYAVAAIPRSSQPSDGLPTGSIDPRKSPVNDTAQSWCAEVEQAAFGWGEKTNVDDNIRWLTQHTPDADQDALQEFATLSERLAKEAQRFTPAHIQTQQLTTGQCAGHHCQTIEELAWVLNSLGKPKPAGTLRRWASEGQLTKTQHGYPLGQALDRITK